MKGQAVEEVASGRNSRRQARQAPPSAPDIVDLQPELREVQPGVSAPLLGRRQEREAFPGTAPLSRGKKGQLLWVWTGGALAVAMPTSIALVAVPRVIRFHHHAPLALRSRTA